MATARANGLVCANCGSGTLATPKPFQAYNKHHEDKLSRMRTLKVFLIVGDCFFIGMQPILVYMTKVDGKFLFNPVSVNFLTELTKITFAVIMLFAQARKQRPGEMSLLSWSVITRAARSNYLLAVPAFLYSINNYLKFVMQLYFKPATVKMLSNLKVLTIAILLKLVMKRRFSVMQWEALCLLLIGISVNQMPCGSANSNVIAPLSAIAWVYTCLSVTIPSTASVYNEFALKSQFDTSVHLQNLFTYVYGALFNFLGLVVVTIMKGGDFRIFEGHSSATMLLVANNAAQGILSSFFFKYADTILKKYSSTIATIFTGLASAALFGHTLTINFVLGVSIVFISMHQFFASVAQPKKLHTHKVEDGGPEPAYAPIDSRMAPVESIGKDLALLNMNMGASDEVNHMNRSKSEMELLLPR